MRAAAMSREILIDKLDRAIERWERSFAEVEANLKKAKELRKCLADTPDSLLSLLTGQDDDSMMDTMFDSLNKPKPAPTVNDAATNGEARKTHFQTISEYLEAHDNRPCTIGYLAEAMSIPKGSIATVLYKTHKGYFQSFGIKGYARLRAWCLERLPRGETASVTESERLHKRTKPNNDEEKSE
jgi:hypothetical protein